MTYALILKDEIFVKVPHCCDEMAAQANQFYPEAESSLLGSTDKKIYWSPIFDEYGLICQPSAEILIIKWCLFCGSKLPSSKRDAWFEKLESTGWQSWEDPIPHVLLTAEWENT